MSEVYRFIAAEKASYPVTLLCRVLGVPRSSFYAWAGGEQARRARLRADDALAHEITVVHLASRGAYGVPRVHAELRRLGHGVNRKRVERLMRERGIAGVTRRHRRSLTRPDKQARPAPDLIGRDFTAARPGTRLVGDITYLPTEEGWLYLACWLDLATREIVGYAMADHHRADLVVDALHMAHGRGRLEPDCIAHSDHGAQYGFNWSSQHLVRMEVLDGASSAGSGPGAASEAEVSGASEVSASCRGGVLDGDRQGPSA
nr:IS3 family transposase [Streptomyces sp. NBC_00899]